jgi:hypothetical protein
MTSEFSPPRKASLFYTSDLNASDLQGEFFWLRPRLFFRVCERLRFEGSCWCLEPYAVSSYFMEGGYEQR